MAVFPLLVGATLQAVATKMLIAALFAAAFNLLAGQAGLLSFGHAAYFGFGAIVTLHFMALSEKGTFSIPTPIMPLVGLLSTLAFATIAGSLVTKRSGTYFSLVTLAIAELIHVIAPLWDDVFGGEAGLTAMRMPWHSIAFASTREVYYLVAIWVAIAVAALWALSKTAYGQLVRALRNNEVRVEALGYNAHLIKTVAFGMSGAFAGLAGALLALSNETANYSLFSASISIEIVFFCFIGGTTLFFAPISAAALLTAFPFLVSNYTRAWPLYEGMIFMAVMLYAPNGVGVWLANVIRKWGAGGSEGGPFRSMRPAGAILPIVGLIVLIETISRGHASGSQSFLTASISSYVPLQAPNLPAGLVLGAFLIVAGSLLVHLIGRREALPPDLASQPGGAN
ncbi:branched-chain amino acid ABC transporter permease [Bradyrhizobium sp. CCGB12]|uniref:branched-chain amino acid ABC transporter permease n=1 Tax=Bradyrhizobium sp. CCGB12 TaxID=2949632 RepID=UPI002811FD07|nr:branched-chain amino acid ABC transporter permease [Bradyrhizobium sp. CCGB12]